MEIIVQPDSQAASRIAARIVSRVVREKARPVLGLATGNTPLQVYKELVRMHREEGLSFAGATTFNLDEYIGLSSDHPSSFHAFMDRNLFDHINVPRKRIHIPDGQAKDIPEFCRRYEEDIRSSGGIDLQVLGIGTDGHIGFNEPSSSLASRTRIKTLTAQTRKDNASSFGGEENVPYHCITMGVGTILDSRICLLLAFGEKKARAVAAACEGPVTATVPASALQMHPRAVVILDREAASGLERTDYYQWVYAHKPDWQKY
jgi:glucosamine-6-phosphate deaminase